MPTILKTCQTCTSPKPLSDYYDSTVGTFGKHANCKACHAAYQKRLLDDNPVKYLLSLSRSEAQANGIEHQLKEADVTIPPLCPYFGTEFDFKRPGKRGERRGPTAPAISRLDASKGFVAGNVEVISLVAHKMKQDVPVSQLVKFAEVIFRRYK